MSSRPSISPQKLFKHPKLLLHKKPLEGHVFGPFNGLVGTVISEGDSFITSPNYHGVYEPQLGGDRRVYLRENLRYGPDDPLQWPQPYIPHLGHYIAIRRPIKDPKDPLHIMWCIPEKSEFVTESTSLISGLGRVNSHFFASINSLCQDLLKRKTPFDNISTFVPSLSAHLSPHLHRLEHLLTDFKTMITHVRSVQHLYIELLALTNFLEFYQLRMDGSVTPPPGLAPVMGAFVTDALSCEMLLRAHIRVWFIRPYTDLDNARVRSLVALHLPVKLPSRPYEPIRVIFTGSAKDPEKHRQIMQATLRTICHADPFSTVVAPIDPVLPPDALTEPPAKRVKLDPKAGRNKCEDPKVEYYPPAISSWNDALHRVSEHIPNPNPPNSSARVDVKYAFPDPAAIASTKNEDRQKHMFKTWLIWRTSLIYRLSFPDSPSEVLSWKVWRSLLNLGFDTRTGQAGEPTKAQQTATFAKDFLKSCLHAANTLSTSSSSSPSLAVSASNTAIWNGRPFGELTNTEYEEILWELCELNFRYEFIALDARAVNPTPPAVSTSTATLAQRKSHQELVDECFPSINTGSLFLFSLTSANRGIASHDPVERSKFTLAFRALMRTWVGPHPTSFHDAHKTRWSPEEMVQLEKDVASFYCRSFIKYLRRAPIVPHRLRHIIPPIQPPTGPLTMLNPSPNVFYDLTALVFDVEI
ncbi:hypothetical protein BDN72DRAFT_906326 [Pluteus cervinus]|uniref:Uncharacterized protein n=1 Tax=Pluteus cervinus TaxID=181527 RepID=A0ACD3A1X7_9AGAR|nr:hypothetical protein BDN72DRAFT_906326 [Pluteus cervinus]